MEMRKEWVRPLTTVEQFVPNEYCSTCGDQNKVYKFKCDAPAGTLYYYPESDGKIDGNYNGSGSAERMGSYHPCGATHDAPTTGDFYDGFVDRNRNGRQDDGEGVIVWRHLEWGWTGLYMNGHATKDLNMDTWETAKS